MTTITFRHRRHEAGRRILPAVAIIAGLLLAVSPAGRALAHEGHHHEGTFQDFQPTASYIITLEIGPQEPMLTHDHAAGAKEGQVVVIPAGMPAMKMVTTDQGHPVNRHLEVYVKEVASGKTPADAMPRITITDQKSKASRELSSVVKMYDVKEGLSDLHFGNNVYLPAGTYTITVTTGGETAVFKDVVLGQF